MKVDSNTTRKINDHVETTIEEPHVESHVDSHVEANVETFVPTSGDPQTETHVEPTFVEPPIISTDQPHDKENPSEKYIMVKGHTIDILVLATNVNDILDENDD
ncbi:unnamed protein product [Vicia faba]|uniref:Uncharacterized protein n=1 Tax=Vicia faba TaxID=3906 RepID=A0AAV0ZC99_VICFA|nr:unnamed protein product [Vicia faba]